MINIGDNNTIINTKINGGIDMEEGYTMDFNNKETLEHMKAEILNQNLGNSLYFAKISETAKIPTKDDENMGYDIYADFYDRYMLINPHETKMIPTGICSACNEDYAIVLKERGSTGTKGIAQRCGVIDSGYRNEWFVPLTNTTDDKLVIIKQETLKMIKDYRHKPMKRLIEEYGENFDMFTWEIEKIEEDIKDAKTYPYEKAIAQAVVLPVPKMNVQEIPLEVLKSIPSKRGEGCLGSSGK